MTDPGVERPPNGAASDSPLVLVFNAGSSSLKGSVVTVRAVDGRGAAASLAAEAAHPRPAVASVELDWGDDASRGPDAQEGVGAALANLEHQGVQPGALAAAAHRVVHGGEAFREAILVDDEVLGRIESLAPLAPLHNRVAVAVIRAARMSLPAIPHLAAFDTAFHAGLPEPAWRYPLPASWDGWGIRRYGFHGLSVAWAAARAAALLERPASELAVVVAHLGSGCSVTAVLGGRSVATSMGLTPLEGLMMGTRAGSIDPGILLAVLRERRRSLDGLAEDLDHQAGLVGVAGRRGGLRELEAAAALGDARAGLAIDMFVDRAAAGIAAIATALPRLDALVFTGGIGEHAGAVRARIVERLGVIGLPEVEAGETGADRILAVPESPARSDGATARARGRDRGSALRARGRDWGSAARARGRDPGPVVLRVAAREDVVAAVEAMAVLRRGPEPE